jgi:hypothetical protein
MTVSGLFSLSVEGGWGDGEGGALAEKSVCLHFKNACAERARDGKSGFITARENGLRHRESGALAKI